MKNWLFNPFTYIAGGRALLIGMGGMLCAATIGFLSRTHFDGVVDLHNGMIAPFYVHVLEQITAWAAMTILFFAGGKAFSQSSIRLIDVAGTMAMARWVTIFPAVLGFGIDAPSVIPERMEDLLKMITPVMIVLALLSAVFIVWMVALMYNAFRVSCNVKGGRATGVFIVCLLLSETAAWLTIHKIIYHTI